MMDIFLKTLAAFCFLMLIVSCNRSNCQNTNPIFDEYSPETKEYKDELVKQLSKVDKSELTYWMGTYQEDKNSQGIMAHVQGDGLCAKIVLSLNGVEQGIEEIISTKGMGYSGAELEDLKFDIKQGSTTTEFVFREISGIVD